METTEQKKPFNISFSAMNNFRGCERGFYYGYVKHFPQESSLTAYGDAGGAVHHVLESYDKSADELILMLAEVWKEKKLDTTNRGMFNRLLKQEQYIQSVITAKSRNYDIAKHEERLEFKYRGYNIKGFIDVITKDETVIDWKTSSKPSGDYKEQMKFYAMLYYQKYKRIPKNFIIDYIKIDQISEDTISMVEVKETKKKIDDFINEVESKKKFVDWSFNQENCFFCAFKKRCQQDMVKKESEKFIIEIKGSKFKIVNPTTVVFDKVIDRIFSYPIANKEIVIANYRRKTGRDWDGMIKLNRYGWYGIGLLDKMIKHIEEYGVASKKHIEIEIKDSRLPSVKIDKYQDVLNNIELRDYQIDAAKTALNVKTGIIKIATSGGKTVIASEIYRRNPVKTLFLVDRIILINQTVAEFENTLDIKGQIGIITGGKIDEKSSLTVGNIQTISSALTAFKKADKKYKTNRGDIKLKEKRLAAKEKTIEMQKFLSDVDCIIVDETHVAASAGYNTVFDNLVNCHYRIGLTATPGDKDENFLELIKNVGEVIYDVSAKQLIEENTIMKPTINFLKYDFGFLMTGDFNDRLEQLYDNEKRNKVIIDLCKKHKNDVIMVLVSRINHGLELIDKLIEAKLDGFFIQGSVDAETREKILNDAREGHPRVLIGTNQIVSKGLNLKPLKVIINATGNVSDKQTIQSLGRILRMHEGKESATCYDFYDDIPDFKEHSVARIKIFKEEGHEVNIIEEVEKFINC